MPKGKHGGGAAKRKERAVREAYRRERQATAYLSPGDPEFKSFSNQLAVQGLKLRDVTGDGNCLFRALSLQLRDRLVDHRQLRRDVVEYMRTHRPEFEPFVEDETFEDYVSDLAKDGEYAGNDAIVAFARCYSANVVIHQLNSPRWEVTANAGGPMLHIAYLNGEHYCSVEPIAPEKRLPPARPPPQRGGSEATLLSGASVRGGASVGGGTTEEVQTVLEATGCKDLGLVERSLCENSYIAELAIVEVLQLMSLSDSAEPGGKDTSHRTEPQSLQGTGKERQVQVKEAHPPQASTARHKSNRERKAEAKAARKERKRESKSTGKGKTDSEPKESPFGSMAI